MIRFRADTHNGRPSLGRAAGPAFEKGPTPSAENGAGMQVEKDAAAGEATRAGNVRRGRRETSDA